MHAQNDWAQDIFLSRKNGSQLEGAQARPPIGKPGKGIRGVKTGDGLDPSETGEKVDAAKKENVFVRPDLPPGKGQWQWRVLRAEWSPEDTLGFEAFITAIGESDCKTVHECITSAAANPRYHATNPPYTEFRADCADLPGFLRGYFAFKNGLPFSFSIKYAAHPRAPGNRTGITGNQISERYEIIGPGPDSRRALPVIGQYVSTEHFRVPPAYTGKLLPDYYPVKLNGESIRPGTVIFDPDGHVAVVYKVSADGLIHYIDAHPDNSLTRGIYGRDFGRAPPEMGAGFKRWRPQVLVGATRASDGQLVGGRIDLAADPSLADWSDEQYYGTKQPRPRLWSDGKFEIGGVEADYYDYLRLSLAGPNFKYKPLEETRTRIRALCDDLNERVAAVDLAVKAGYPRRPQPPKLPANIYSTSGEWEIYSTPSRDARMKTSFGELHDEVQRFIEMGRQSHNLLDYAGDDLRADLRHVYEVEASACTITYVQSNGNNRSLGFTDVMRRLFDMSFDPYHCVELRWGATSAEELKTCPDGADKRAWYKAQDRLRNQLTRTYGEPMGWTLAQLQNRGADIGIAEVPDVDVQKILSGIEDDMTPVAAKTPTAVAGRNRRATGRAAAQPAAGRPPAERLLVPARHRP